MFALQSKLGQPLYQADICDKRWTTAYYKSNQRLFSTQNSNPSLFSQSNSRKQRNLSHHEKYRQAVVTTSQLASITSMVHFHCRISVLKELLDYWKCGEEVEVEEV